MYTTSHTEMPGYDATRTVAPSRAAAVQTWRAASHSVYAPPTFTSRDPMFEKKPWLTPYHYCSNNPVGRVDPTGCEDEYTWVKTGDGKLVYDSDVHDNADAEAKYGEGSVSLPDGTRARTSKGNPCTLVAGGYEMDGVFYKVKDLAPSKFSRAMTKLDNGGHADPANTGLITQQDVVVGCAVLGIMAGGAATIEAFAANKFLGGIVSAVGTLNAIDDAGTNAQGRSLSEQAAGGNNCALTAIRVAKTAIDATNVVVGSHGMIKKDIKTFGAMSTVLSSVSTGNNAKKIKK